MSQTKVQLVNDVQGDVGFGTASPDQILHLNKSSGDTYLRLQGGTNQGTLIHATDGTLLGGFVSGGAVGGGASDMAMRVEGGNAMLFAHGTTERMRIDLSGNVGIGNTDPSQAKAVIQSASGTQLALVKDNNGASLSLGGVTQPRILLEADPSSSKLQIYTAGGSTYGSANYTARLSLDSSGDLRVQRIYNNTTSGGANVRVQSDGLLQRDTSSRRYKNTIVDATHGLADLNKLRSVTYKGNNDGDTIFGGLIAEEVHDAGLIEFVDYNSDNEPDALRYGNMVSLCIKSIQQLSAKVETLEAALQEAIGRIEALEAK